MQAKELVTILATMPQKKEHYQLYLGEQPVTNLKIDAADDFVFSAENRQPALTLQTILVLLMTNRSRELYYLKDNQKRKVYGIKEKDKKIIL